MAADIFTCAAGEFKNVHWNVRGAEFDTMHDVAQRYYERASKDADELSEWTVGMMGTAGSPNEAATRCSWPLADESTFDRNSAVAKFTDMILVLVGTLETLLNEGPALGNYVATALEFWAKEFRYFNNRRQ
jgi:DNA-binding ferritin-like protein